MRFILCLTFLLTTSVCFAQTLEQRVTALENKIENMAEDPNVGWKKYYLVQEYLGESPDGGPILKVIKKEDITGGKGLKAGRKEANAKHASFKASLVGKKYIASYYVPRHDIDGTKGGNRPSIMKVIEKNY